MKCPNCGNEINDEITKCPYCDAELAKNDDKPDTKGCLLRAVTIFIERTLSIALAIFLIMHYKFTEDLTTLTMIGCCWNCLVLSTNIVNIPIYNIKLFTNLNSYSPKLKAQTIEEIAVSVILTFACFGILNIPWTCIFANVFIKTIGSFIVGFICQDEE